MTYIEKTRPDLISTEKAAQEGSRGWVIGGILITLAALFLSPFASGNPDGLERVAQDLGFLSIGQNAPFKILPDYTLPFLGGTALSTILAGIIGAVILIGLLILLGRNLRKPTQR
jgi:cobalt/nickel transport system permease protein